MSYVKVLTKINDKLKKNNCDSLNYFVTEYTLSDKVAKDICDYLSDKLNIHIKKSDTDEDINIYLADLHTLLSSNIEVQKLTIHILGHNVTVDIDTNNDGEADDSLLISPEEYHRHREAMIKYFVTMGICCVVLLCCLGYVFGVTFFSDTISDAHARFVDQSLSSIYNVISMIIVVICNNANISMQQYNTNKKSNQNNSAKRPMS